jgi:hypothetical protein
MGFSDVWDYFNWGVFLLACMLARKFGDAKFSMAICVELVEERQKESQSAVNNNEAILESTIIAGGPGDV